MEQVLGHFVVTKDGRFIKPFCPDCCPPCHGNKASMRDHWTATEAAAAQDGREAAACNTCEKRLYPPGPECCGRQEMRCICVLTPGHDGPHACSDDCGGKWTFDDVGEFVGVALPGIGRMLADLG